MFAFGLFEFTALFGVTAHDPMTGECLGHLFRFLARFL